MDADSIFAAADARIARWERRLDESPPPALEAVLEDLIEALGTLLVALLAEAGRPAPPAGTDLLETFKALVRGEPSWNAIRDNLRELVYYRNCLAGRRADALPARPERMAVRTARHVHLYLCTRRAAPAGRAAGA